MGLDMYLYAREPVEAYVPRNPTVEDDGSQSEYIGGWGRDTSDERARYRELLDALGIPLDTCPGSPHITAELEKIEGLGEAWVLKACIAYWRKVNAVHAWFVDHCQNGVDECQGSDPIPREKLSELRDLAQRAHEAYRAGDREEAGALLTPRSGFFFGSTDVDEWFDSDMIDTVEQLDRVLTLPARLQIIYRSSW